MAGSIALPFVVGEALEWTLPFIASIFALQLLAVRRPPPTLVAGLASIAGLCIAFLVALVLTGLVLPYPTIFVLVIGLTMFGGLYAQARTASPFWFIFLTAVAVIPLLATKSDTLAASFASALVLGMVAAVGVVWLMHALFPEPVDSISAPAEAPISSGDAARTALIGTLVLMPLGFLLLVNESEAIVASVTALSITRAAGFAGGARTALGLLLGI
jgi:hypothetical protein